MVVRALKTSDGGILDFDDILSEVVDDRELVIILLATLTFRQRSMCLCQSAVYSNLIAKILTLSLLINITVTVSMRMMSSGRLFGCVITQ